MLAVCDALTEPTPYDRAMAALQLTHEKCQQSHLVLLVQQLQLITNVQGYVPSALPKGPLTEADNSMVVRTQSMRNAYTDQQARVASRSRELSAAIRSMVSFRLVCASVESHELVRLSNNESRFNRLKHSVVMKQHSKN